MCPIAVIGGWLYLGIHGGPDTVPNEDRVAPVAESPRSSLDDSALAVEARDPVASHDSAEARVPADARNPDRSPESIPTTAKAHSGVGHLRVRAVDSETGSPVQRIRVRAMNDSRLADRSSERDGEAVEVIL